MTDMQSYETEIPAMPRNIRLKFRTVHETKQECFLYVDDQGADGYVKFPKTEAARELRDVFRKYFTDQGSAETGVFEADPQKLSSLADVLSNWRDMVEDLDGTTLDNDWYEFWTIVRDKVKCCTPAHVTIQFRGKLP